MSVKSLSQTQRVLRLAYARGDIGITAVDFQLPDVADGGTPILRVAARIKDLEDDGINFFDGGRRNKVKVYILDRVSLADATKPPTTSGPSAAGVPSPPATAADGTGADTLFEAPQRELDFDLDICPPPHSAINDDLDAAA